MVVEDLKEKVEGGMEKASDEFLYQDKSEAKHELEVGIIDIGKHYSSFYLSVITIQTTRKLVPDPRCCNALP
ncbi:hypothetical protein [Bacillus sp. OK048]|uniref:hypothetical protein n=1 Tax=Bacillus sp. OK048 TaxID=1882761 RepID=UPI000B85F461|nr:hypothetical protein [Bacillus sp. OK048]